MTPGTLFRGKAVEVQTGPPKAKGVGSLPESDQNRKRGAKREDRLFGDDFSQRLEGWRHSPDASRHKIGEGSTRTDGHDPIGGPHHGVDERGELAARGAGRDRTALLRAESHRLQEGSLRAVTDDPGNPIGRNAVCGTSDKNELPSMS